MRRVLAAAATAVALSIPASVAVIGTSPSAFAASTTTCAKASGSVAAGVTVSKCVVPKADKKTYKTLHGASITAGGTLTWNGGQTMTVGPATVTSGGTGCKATQLQVTATATVTAISAGADPAVAKVGDTFSLNVCYTAATGAFTINKGTVVTI